MASSNSGINTPSGMGGLMRFNEEYPSKLMISPEQVMIGIVVIIIGLTILRVVL